MTGPVPRSIGRRLIDATAVVVMVLLACLPTADDPAGRQEVLDMLRRDELATVDDWRRDRVYLLPPELDHASEGGEISVHRDGASLVVLFFDFRGLNHYTGWVYSSEGQLTEDPQGNQPFISKEIAPNWYRVDAG